MKNVGNSSNGRSQGVQKISGHPCIGRMGALRGHLCDSTAFLLMLLSLTASFQNALKYAQNRKKIAYKTSKDPSFAAGAPPRTRWPLIIIIIIMERI